MIAQQTVRTHYVRIYTPPSATDSAHVHAFGRMTRETAERLADATREDLRRSGHALALVSVIELANPLT